ncbi:MAG: (2Fe-2S)-binding protein [Sphingomonadales bacterium]|nr:MAG: (2Fe-2S)-binding protein [Sphingomonadales bacterium]
MFRKLDPDRAVATAVSITLDGQPLSVEEGEPIAAILLRQSFIYARRTPVTGTARAPFCMMGVCFECLVEVDGTTSVRSCLTRARAGMDVRRQLERPDPMRELKP